jgi:hypothetical protein
MDHAKHFDQAVGRDSVDDEMSRRSDAAFRRDPQPAQPCRVRAHAGQPWNAAGSGQAWVVPDRGHRRDDQQAVARGPAGPWTRALSSRTASICASADRVRR